MLRLILAIPLILAPVWTRAEDKKPEKAKADPEGTSLELSIKGTLKYNHDTIGFTAAEYKAAIDAVAKGKKKLPRPPFVDLTVELKNTSDKPVKVWVAGDPVVLTLNLKGKGAVNFDPKLAFTEEFRLPRAVEIAAGKAHAFELTSLTSGFRGQAHYSYWTDPGEYEFVATVKTAMLPAPKGAKEAMNGFGNVTLTSAPVKLTIVEKK